MGSVRLYGATSGYLELQAPDVSPDAALVLPSTGFGKVLQVVRATDSTQRTTTSTSFTDVTGMSVTITPQKSDSAVMIIMKVTALLNVSTTSNRRGEVQITDSSNNAISGAEAGDLGIASLGSAMEINQGLLAIGYATPATTSAVTYKVRFKVNSSSATLTFDNNVETGQLYAIEVAA